ncbi:transporter [Cognatilysobacter lacus]|uniref:Transporter n=1 Tax=Cognatilysobacter lacus TaxID=1643323 RepID=A0A5D8YYF3_9GAMM|nr:transporter [Lysobacter lacus]TZF87266.1 transporter [Lysobacter lacus]
MSMTPVTAARSAPWFLAAALAVGSMDTKAAEPPADVGDQLKALGEKLEAQQAEIDRLHRQVEDLELAQARGRGLSGDPQSASAPPGGTDTGAAATAQATPPAEPLQVGQAQRAEDEQRREQDKALVVREHAPLFERKFTLDSGFTWSYYDRRQLTLSGFLALDAIFLGTINLDQSKASLETFDITGRYGLTDRLSLEASLPYVFRDTRFVSGGAGGASTSLSEVSVSSHGIGDASLAAYYQIVKENARWPDVVGSLRVKAPTGRDPFGLKLIQANGDNTNLIVPADLPTGSGLWSVTGNVSVLRTYDPVILFGNVGYTWNRPGNFDDISPVLTAVAPARVSLGQVFQLSGGVAIALNDRAAISLSVATAMQAATHTRAPGDPKDSRVPGSSSNSTALNIGSSYVLPSGWTFSGQLAAGLTPDSPNYVIALRSSRSF